MPNETRNVGIGAILAATLGVANASAADLELGRYLAAQCLSCHGTTQGGAIPSLVGMPERAFTAAIDAFRSKRRSSQIMSPIVERLTDEDIVALARYFAAAPPPR